MKARDLNGRGGGRTKVHGGGRKSGGRIPHDQAWKALLQSAIFMESLIRCFVEPVIVAALDLSRLERRSGEYVARGLRTLRGDIVWRAPWRDGSGYLYFPVELQSRPDAGMPWRMTEYVAQLRQAADERELAPCETPWAYPLVIYTERDRWNVVSGMEDTRRVPPGMPEAVRSALADCQVRLDIRVLSVLHLPAGALEKMDGVAPRLFRLAQSADPEEAEALAVPLLERLKGEGFAGLRDAVMQWIWHILLPMLGIDEAMPKHTTYEELVHMTQVVLDGWKARFMERGREEGRAEGEAKGRAEGEAKGRMENALENALNFLKENISVETVARCTGLTLEKVRDLAAGLKKG